MLQRSILIALVLPALIILFFVLQTPDGSFLDVTRNAYDLLRSCGVIMPEVSNISFQWYLFEVLVSSVTDC